MTALVESKSTEKVLKRNSTIEKVCQILDKDHMVPCRMLAEEFRVWRMTE